jgi:hypothetical protein
VTTQVILYSNLNVINITLALNVSPFNKTEIIKTSDLTKVLPARATKLEHRMPVVNNIPFKFSLFLLRILRVVFAVPWIGYRPVAGCV